MKFSTLALAVSIAIGTIMPAEANVFGLLRHKKHHGHQQHHPHQVHHNRHHNHHGHRQVRHHNRRNHRNIYNPRTRRFDHHGRHVKFHR